MSNYRRYFVPGGTYFFTIVTHLRRKLFAEQRCRDWLYQAFTTIRATKPFDMPALVLMPDHLHAIWTLPPGDAKYSTRWRRIKEEFTQAFLDGGGREGPVSAARRKRGVRGVWQIRFWEHTIDDEHDFERHFDYIHYNPVKHGLVSCPRDWLHSSFHRSVERGVYGADWGRMEAGTLSFDDLNETAME
ncbi:MAG: transposase [Planctomycetota bacterium]|nr:transposase [Planctomycetota bacterium]